MTFELCLSLSQTILIIISIVSFLLCFHLANKNNIFGCFILLFCIIINLIMWLIYFIIN